MNNVTLSARSLTFDSNTISITQVNKRNVYFKVADALVQRISALEGATIDLSNYSNASVSISATSGNIAFATTGSNKVTYNGVEVATINDLPTTATNSVSGLVKVTNGNGLTLTSGTIAMGLATATSAGAVKVETWSSSNLNGLGYAGNVITLPSTVATSTTASGGLISYSVSNNSATITLNAATATEIKAGTTSNKVITPAELAGAKNVAGGFAGIGTDGYIPEHLIKATVVNSRFFVETVSASISGTVPMLQAFQCVGYAQGSASTIAGTTTYTKLNNTQGNLADIPEGGFVAYMYGTTDVIYKKVDGEWVVIPNDEVRSPIQGDEFIVEVSNGKVDRYLAKVDIDYSGAATQAMEGVPHIVDLADTTKFTKLVETEDVATTHTLGLVKIGENITVTATGTISVGLASSSAFGVVKAGTNVTISSGVLSVATASSSVLGLVKVGTNINISSGTISVATATTSVLGLVKVGTNITVSDGTISVATATTSVLGLVKVGTNINVSNGTISVATATSTTKGVLSVDTSDRLKIESGVLSYANTAIVAVGGVTATASSPAQVGTALQCLYSYYYPTRVKVTYVSGSTTVVEVYPVMPNNDTSVYEVYLDTNYHLATVSVRPLALVWYLLRSM